MKRNVALKLPLALLLVMASSVWAAEGNAVTDPKQADEDFAFQGEYAGELGPADGEKHAWGAQIVALGGGKFSAVGYPGGLPGDGWDGKEKKAAEGQRDGDKATFKTPDGAILTIAGGVLSVTSEDGKSLGEMKKVERKSKTLGAKAPEGAIVLFDGKSADAWENGKISPEGWLMQGVTSKQKFGSFKAHLEFLLPYMPAARGQGRGNSGCYFQGRYEVQMLDSFGLEGLDNECGGLYQIARPQVNMCYPPLSWQTYDIDFTAAEYKDGEKVKDATVTILHNGVEIHKDVKLPHATRAAPWKEGSEPGPIYLQDHGNPVRYRNIWVVEK